MRCWADGRGGAGVGGSRDSGRSEQQLLAVAPELAPPERSTMIEWVVANLLARASRPGYESRDFSRAATDRWIAEARDLGAKSILCLLENELYDYANSLRAQGGLLDYYRSCGFIVHAVCVADGAEPPLTAKQLDSIAEVFRDVTKPLLIHCSAGVDRTGAAVAHILRLEESKKCVQAVRVLLARTKGVRAARRATQRASAPYMAPRPDVVIRGATGDTRHVLREVRPVDSASIGGETGEVTEAIQHINRARQLIQQEIATAPDATCKRIASNLLEEVLAELRRLQGDRQTNCWHCGTIFWRNEQAECALCHWNNCPKCNACHRICTGSVPGTGR
jgi:Tyrosine phosphatase family